MVWGKNGHAYKVFKEKLLWPQAKQRCEELGGHLVSITSQEEQEFLHTVIEKSGIAVDTRQGLDSWREKLWAGGTDEGSEGKWRWVDGSAWGFTPWVKGQPDGDGNFLNICPHIRGGWNDDHAVGALVTGFICEWPKRAVSEPPKDESPQVEPDSRKAYLPLPLGKVATAVSTRGMFTNPDDKVERLAFPKWGLTEFDGVPYSLVDPQGQSVANVVMLHGPRGYLPPKMPKVVTVPFGQQAKAIHLLSGVSGWGFPATRQGTVSMIVQLAYADGKKEDHLLVNGEHMADYIRRVDVPKSTFAFNLGGRQVRHLRIEPGRPEAIASISLVKGNDETAPLVVAMTIERARSGQQRAGIPPDPIVGTWRWYVNGGEFPGHEFLPKGLVKDTPDASWLLVDPKERRYQLVWGDRRFIDVMTLSPDGTRLEGRNNEGAAITGVRVK